MENVRLACGHRSKTPYLIDKLMVRVYSPEELCYSIVLDAYLLDETFASEELAKWLGEECGLDDLCRELTEHVRRKGSVEGYARIIMEYVGFYDDESIAETCAVIRDNASLSVYEKNKARADYYLMCGRVTMALEAYNELLESIPENEKKVRASIWHNCGYAYTRMFRFAEAAKAYYCSYKTLPGDDSLRQFLTALRISRDDKEYLDYISGHPEFFDMSQRVEKSIRQAEGSFEGTDEFRSIMAMKMLREESTSYGEQTTPYYEQLDKLLEDLKSSYREMVAT